jgi:SAM-dependent methyltransferase
MNPQIQPPGASRERVARTDPSSRLDAGTIRRLKALGLLSGWRCAEVGTSVSSIAVWLAARVARMGRVLAVDTETRFLDPLRREGLEIRQHDITAAPLESEYDLVHTRLSGLYLAQRDRALHHMAESLRPGGWLLIEEYDLGPAAGFYNPVSELQRKVNGALERLLERSSADARDGMPLVAALRSCGLTDVQSQPRASLVSLGLPRAEALLFQLEELRDRLVDARLLTEGEVDRAVQEALVHEGAVHETAATTAVWGRMPTLGI